MSLRLYLLSSAVPVPHTHTEKGEREEGREGGKEDIKGKKGPGGKSALTT